MSALYRTLRPLLFLLDPETAHGLTLKAMKAGLAPRYASAADPVLETTLWGLKFPNPVGLAAGFDKNAEIIGPAFHLGFGFVEAGTVTPKPQEGNPRPRVFRDARSRAVINRMGFPGEGMAVFKSNLEKFLGHHDRPHGVLGINIGMNKNQKEPAKDYAILIRMLGPLADYLTVNISSPNTPGLRDLQKREPLLDLLGTLKDERRKACGNHPPPLLVKLAPDLDEAQQEELAQTLLDAEIEGAILTNTTLERPAALGKSFAQEKGGLSGTPLKDKSTQVISNFSRITGGRLPIIGLGGISTGRDAYDKIRAGASLVQLYTGLVFRGPSVAHSVNEELARLLKADGFSNVAQAVGINHKGNGQKA